MAFSPDGSKFAAAHSDIVFVYDVASLTRLGEYFTPSGLGTRATWAPDGRHVLVSWEECDWDGSMCLWDFTRPEEPSVVAVEFGSDTTHTRVHSWSPSGASYFLVRFHLRRTRNGEVRCVMEEWSVEGLLVRAVNLGTGEFDVLMPPDSHALLLDPFDGGAPARVVVFD